MESEIVNFLSLHSIQDAENTFFSAEKKMGFFNFHCRLLMEKKVIYMPNIFHIFFVFFSLFLEHVQLFNRVRIVSTVSSPEVVAKQCTSRIADFARCFNALFACFFIRLLIAPNQKNQSWPQLCLLKVTRMSLHWVQIFYLCLNEISKFPIIATKY